MMEQGNARPLDLGRLRLEEHGRRESGGLVLRLCAAGGCAAHTGTVLDRLRLAAQWVTDLDSQYVELLEAGENPRLTVPARNPPAVGPVARETVGAYRRLQLDVGALIRPLLLEPPELDELYPFQRVGARWLVERTGAILADDMGLGKTVQVIAAMRLLFNRGRLRMALVICPKSLIGTWERECQRWAPELGVAGLTPPASIREEAWAALARRRHVLVTNYEQFRRPPEALLRTGPDLIVADEAHRLRNYGAQVTSGCFRLESGRRWALTGTPLERDAEDVATLLSLVAPMSFAPSDSRSLHRASLSARARPYVLRRRKSEVLDDLPEVLDATELLDLTDAQARAQRRTIDQYRLQGRSGGELALFTLLQAICDIDSETRESSKLDRILYTLGRVREELEKAVVFSYRLDPLKELQRRIVERWGAKASELLVGQMDGKARDSAILRFRTDGNCLALLASSRVAGEGLTLVEANHVFLLNQWWNPSANDQARDRVVRIGQRRRVRVYRYCCRGSVEETLERVLKSKRELFKNVVERLAGNDSSAWEALLSEVGIGGLLPSGSSG